MAQNLVLAVGSIAVLALPMLLGAIPLWVAVACHEGSTLLVVLNSLRLLRGPSPPVVSPLQKSTGSLSALAVRHIVH